MPLALAVFLVLGGCDEEEKDKVVDVQIEKGTEVRIKVREDETSEMIILGELALFTAVIVWALLGPGATRFREEATSEHR